MGEATKQINRLNQYVESTHDRDTGVELAAHLNEISMRGGSIGRSIQANCQDLQPDEVAEFRQAVHAFDDEMTAKGIPPA